jgi:hypothetical protein
LFNVCLLKNRRKNLSPPSHIQTHIHIHTFTQCSPSNTILVQLQNVVQILPS